MLVGTSKAPSSKPPYFGPKLYKAEAKMPVCFYATLFGTEECLFNIFLSPSKWCNYIDLYDKPGF